MGVGRCQVAECVRYYSVGGNGAAGMRMHIPSLSTLVTSDTKLSLFTHIDSVRQSPLFVALGERCCSRSWIWGIRRWCSGMIICMSRGPVSPWGRPLCHVSKTRAHLYYYNWGASDNSPQRANSSLSPAHKQPSSLYKYYYCGQTFFKVPTDDIVVDGIQPPLLCDPR